MLHWIKDDTCEFANLKLMCFSLDIVSWIATFVSYDQCWHSRVPGSNKHKIYLFQEKVVLDNHPASRTTSRYRVRCYVTPTHDKVNRLDRTQSKFMARLHSCIMVPCMSSTYSWQSSAMSWSCSSVGLPSLHGLADAVAWYLKLSAVTPACKHQVA